MFPLHSTPFSKCFGVFIVSVVEFTLKILKKKNNLNFPKKLVLSKKIIFNNHGKYVVLCFGKIFENKFSSFKNQHTVHEA